MLLPEEALSHARGAAMNLQVLLMSPDERAAFCAEKAREPGAELLVYFAMLTATERQELVQAALHTITNAG